MNTYHIKEMLYISKTKQNLMKFALYASFLFGTIITAVVILFTSNGRLFLSRQLRYTTDLKYVLIWQPPKVMKYKKVKQESSYSEGQIKFIEQKCSFINCYLTYNKSLLENDSNFDAVIFDIHDIFNAKPEDINLTRSENQKYILKALASTQKVPLCNKHFNNFFNWTWTFKLDSDIPHPFISISDKAGNIIGPKEKMNWLNKLTKAKLRSDLKNKTKAVVWIVPNCSFKSKHQEYVTALEDELKRYNLSLDTYGSCAYKKCPGRKLSNCYKIVEKKYYFTLYIEDTYEDDYVSASIVNHLTHSTIPIILGGADYNRFLPPGAYIPVQEFDKYKLSAVIDYLIKNPKIYNRFYDWRNHYYYKTRSKSSVCDLCSKLNDEHIVLQNKWYKDLRLWWNPYYKNTCKK